VYSRNSGYTDTHEVDVYKYYTTDDKPNVEENEDKLGTLTVEVGYDDEPTLSDTKDADGSCSSTFSTKKCTCDRSNCGGPNQTACDCLCTATGSKQYTDSGHDVNHDKKVSHSAKVKFEDIVFADEGYFSTNPSQNDAPTGSEEGLFDSVGPTWGDNDLDNRQHFWTTDVDSTNNEYFSNSPARSSSEMKIGHMGNEDIYRSVRTWYGTFDADGPYGHGDSYVSVDRGSTRVGVPVFNNESAITSGDGSSLSDPVQPQMDAGFLSPGDYGGTSCPGGKWFCVAAVDVSLKNLDSWSSSTNPGSSAVEFKDDNVRHVNESWGVCRKFQKLIGGAEESYLRCQYDNSREQIFPGGPTPYVKPEVYE